MDETDAHPTCFKPDCPWPCRHHQHIEEARQVHLHRFRMAYDQLAEKGIEGCIYCHLLAQVVSSICYCQLAESDRVDDENPSSDGDWTNGEGSTREKASPRSIGGEDTGEGAANAASPDATEDRASVDSAYSTGSQGGAVHRCMYLEYLKSLDPSSGGASYLSVCWTCCMDTDTTNIGLRLNPKRDIQGASLLYRFPLDHGLGRIEEDALSPDATNLYRAWLDKCEQSHSTCNMLDTILMPSRVLYIAVQNQDTESAIRLVDSSSVKTGYAALSYCWGGKTPPVLKKSWLEAYQKSIDFQDLPILYQDVVKLLRGMRIEYLWIDSLCIVQDSEDDRDHELSRMGAIYANASLVIIPTSNENPDQPLPKTRLQHIWMNVSASSPGDALPLDVQIRNEPGGSIDGRFQGTPVALRAWTYQERLLARRCLIFTEYEAVWQCRGRLTCECHTQGHRRDGTIGWQLLPRPEALNDPQKKYFATPEDAEYYWMALVDNYTSRDMSIPTDRLPAISAMAAIVGKAIGKPYLAGVWWSDRLAQQLCWWPNRVVNYYPQKPVDAYIAPSWSWASQPSQDIRTWLIERHWSHQPSKTSPRFISGGCTPKGRDPLGAVVDGFLMMEAFQCLTKVTLRQADFQHRGRRFKFSRGRRNHLYQTRAIMDNGEYAPLAENDAIKLSDDGDGMDPVGAVVLGESDNNYSSDDDSDCGDDSLKLDLDSALKPMFVYGSAGQRVASLQKDTSEGGYGPDGEQRGCSGEVCLARLFSEVYLVLAYSLRETGAFERLGLLQSPRECPSTKRLHSACSRKTIKVI